MKQNKRYYHEGDGIIREVITTQSSTLKEKQKQLKDGGIKKDDKPKQS